MLTLDAQRLWQEYLATENSGTRDARKAALDSFIDALLQHDQAEWRSWALDVAARVSKGMLDESARLPFSQPVLFLTLAEGTLDVPVRFPLFQRVLLPALAEGVTQGAPGCARALACFDQLLNKSKDVPLPEGLRSAVGLLREALRLDPSDNDARRLLVEHWAHYLAYTLHELPLGVLYGYDGATVAQCDELIDFLREFRGHVAALHQEARFASLMADCELHFSTYRECLMPDCPGGSYKSFMETRPTSRG